MGYRRRASVGEHTWCLDLGLSFLIRPLFRFKGKAKKEHHLLGVPNETPSYLLCTWTPVGWSDRPEVAGERAGGQAPPEEQYLCAVVTALHRLWRSRQLRKFRNRRRRSRQRSFPPQKRKEEEEGVSAATLKVCLSGIHPKLTLKSANKEGARFSRH